MRPETVKSVPEKSCDHVDRTAPRDRRARTGHPGESLQLAVPEGLRRLLPATGRRASPDASGMVPAQRRKACPMTGRRMTGPAHSCRHDSCPQQAIAPRPPNATRCQPLVLSLVLRARQARYGQSRREDHGKQGQEERTQGQEAETQTGSFGRLRRDGCPAASGSEKKGLV